MAEPGKFRVLTGPYCPPVGLPILIAAVSQHKDNNIYGEHFIYLPEAKHSLSGLISRYVGHPKNLPEGPAIDLILESEVRLARAQLHDVLWKTLKPDQRAQYPNCFCGSTHESDQRLLASLYLSGQMSRNVVKDIKDKTYCPAFEQFLSGLIAVTPLKPEVEQQF